MFTVKGAAILAVTLWVIMLFYLSSQLFGIHGKAGYNSEEVSIQLDEAIRSLHDLRKQNEQLKELIEAERRERASERAQNEAHKNRVPPKEEQSPEELYDGGEENSKASDLYSLDHEVARRTLESRIWEIFYYVMDKLSKMKPNDDLVRSHAENQFLSLLATASNFSEVDDAASWRKRSLQSITDAIQAKIHKMQHPDDCRKAKILLCNLDKQCGFGCQLHHVAYCFVTAFGSQRTMMFNGDGHRWRYSKRGWTGAFLPITNCKQQDVSDEQAPAYSLQSTERVVQLGIVDALTNKPAFLPLSIPKSFAEPLLKLHSNPPAFFISQFLWYLMRSGQELKKALNLSLSMIPFNKGPIVGLQIRRTDKVGTEAAFHSVEEYMLWAERWFKIEDSKQGRNVTRRVFVATDDPSVFREIKTKFLSYEVYGDEQTANTAQLESRYTDSSLYGVVRDIRLLSHCNYLVCTFSSQVCRMGFELMQVQQGDAGERFHSLDDIYYFGGQHAHELIAVEDHVPEQPGEIELRVGDIIGVAGNHWDGFSKGVNRRTEANGLYPSYKAVERWRIVDVPSLI
uniref:GT23 domain-containing protein n=1 Tax=Haemonchus contortus TaxID=6289 RepID=A0A7I4YV62_HAECO|nr:Variant SH3 domain containing protein [Haemonchus contortus]